MSWESSLQALVDNLWIYMPILCGLFLCGWMFKPKLKTLLGFVTFMVVFTLFILALKEIALPGVS